MGFLFENICHSHILQIKYALSIGGVNTASYYWRKKPQDKESQGAQIDILLTREDNIINIIECKYYADVFVIDKKYAKELQRKERVFQESSGYQGSITIIMLTLNGVKRNEYYDEVITDDITVKKLFV